MLQENTIASLRNFIGAYENYCKPICKELGMPQMAFDLLMFLANHPEHYTAADFCNMRGFKENIVSVNVNKLVSEGYLIREDVQGDRRKVKLCCTEKAWPIIEKGKRIQENFREAMQKDIPAEDMQIFQKCVTTLIKNAKELSGQSL